MIRIESLQKQFGDKTAVDIPELYIHQGEMIGLVGNNGAGKTTLFRLMLDLIKATKGEVHYVSEDSEPTFDINPAQSEDWKNFTGAYIDEGFLIDFLTPDEFFDFVGKTCDMDQEAIEEEKSKFEDFCNGEIFGQKKLIRDLSAGNKQKIGIIAALFNHPKIVLLDEPFNFLDPSSQIKLKRILKAYHEQTGATVIVNSHNLQHTIDISSRILLLEHGSIIKDKDNKDGNAAEELLDYFKIEA